MINFSFILLPSMTTNGDDTFPGYITMKHIRTCFTQS